MCSQLSSIRNEKMNNPDRKTDFWLGNAAKYRIIREILSNLDDREVKILDYGCGQLADWPEILMLYPSIKLYAFEPNKDSLDTGLQKFTDNKNIIPVRAIDELKSYENHFDVIVSFSVFEHLQNKEDYLKTAYKTLKEGGVFHLNYDDGHFRNFIDLNDRSNWRNVWGEWKRNFKSKLFNRRKFQADFQKRVPRNWADQAITKAGYAILETRYENISSFKDLSKTIPDQQKSDFAKFWIETERALNDSFLHEQETPYWEDTANLWRIMGSRTLKLKE